MDTQPALRTRTAGPTLVLPCVYSSNTIGATAGPTVAYSIC
jgi:hypothetical protein